MKFQLHKTYPSDITSKEMALEAVEDFGCNLCKASRFANDKEVVKAAIKTDPYAVIFASESMTKDPEIKNAMENTSHSLSRLLDPIGYYSIGPNINKGLNLIKYRNELYDQDLRNYRGSEER